MARKQQAGPGWGGQNWRPGKEVGTWFRHSPEYGAIVHYGDRLVILKDRKTLTKEGWFQLREDDKSYALKQASLEAEAKKARELPIEAAKKQAVIDSLIADTEKISMSPDWKIQHVAAKSYETIDGIQESPYEADVSEYFQSIKWYLYYKGVKVWTWEAGCWRRPDIRTNDLIKLGIPVDQISSKCLEHHLSSDNANDPVGVKVLASLVNPKDWIEGSPCRFPLRVTLVGESYDYHYQALEESGEVSYERLTGGDPQDNHTGWGWG